MIGSDLVASRARVLVELDEAARPIAPLWPLGTFIAVNPLWDLRHLGFESAVQAARRWLSISGYPSPTLLADAWRSGRITHADLRLALLGVAADGEGAAAPVGSNGRPDQPDDEPARPGHDESANREAVNHEVAKWCAAYVGGLLPAAGGAFYGAWRASVAHDPGAARLLGREGRARLARLPSRPEDAITSCLERMGCPAEEWAEALTRQLVAMPGWAGHAKWRSRWAPPGQGAPSLHLLDYVAVRIAYDTELHAAPSRRRRRRARWAPTRADGCGGSSDVPRHETMDGLNALLPPAIGRALASLPEADAAQVWLAAYEGHYRDQLLAKLHRPPGPRSLGAAAQVVCCIDTRSEGLRRHLEALGHYETFGFAGFFALPLRYTAVGADPVDLCPVLLAPTVEMAEVPGAGAATAAMRRLEGEQSAARSAHAFDATREGSVSPFVMAEAGGFVAAPLLVAKTTDPTRYHRLRAWARRQLVPSAETVIEADPHESSMSGEAQALFAETALVAMGFAQDFAPLVVLCGHGSTTENNPHGSALDCGACGGNRGADSARAAAAIFNRPQIRALLAERGLAIPGGTWFVAAEHDTATDEVAFFDQQLVPAKHRGPLDRLGDDLARAGAALAAERCRELPGAARAPAAEVSARSADWAEIQPEWGLARNAAFIVAPRSLTAGTDLERRAFLHSYDPEVDPEGTALETILTAPMVVAHWINTQYYFATVDPMVFSAGDKTVHNVVAGIGVTEGRAGDLKTGLPLQSLFVGDRPYHEPMRLLTVVHAPLERIDAVIARNPVLQELFDGQWVQLAARHDGHAAWQLRRSGGSWVPWRPAGLVELPASAEASSAVPPSRPEEVFHA